MVAVAEKQVGSDMPADGKFWAPTVAGEFRLTIKGSKFLGWCSPAVDVSAVESSLYDRSRLYHDATHHCWAYRIGDPERPVERSSDAGEPSGTAGKPILDQLRHRGLIEAMVVVSRWFGGTKLGRGGLIRAYGECTAQVIAATHLKEVVQAAKIELSCEFGQIGGVERMVRRFNGVITSREFLPSPRLMVSVPKSGLSLFLTEMREFGGGRVECRGINDQ